MSNQIYIHENIYNSMACKFHVEIPEGNEIV